jgi:predicted ATPase/tetratricopeptide (TPR) repeat protein/transcriptional regulator with XRE-family HTH domain
MQPEKPFGSWLRERRRALDLTQTELADRVGCALVTVKKFETGDRRPSKQIAQRLAAALMVEPAALTTFVTFARGLSATPPAVPATGTSSGIPHHLPAQPTTFVGRRRELARIRQRLDDPKCRVLTILGPGGIGKTRLAIEAANQHSSEFPDGAHFVPLSTVQSADLLFLAIGDVLSFSFEGKEAPINQLISRLREKTMLLILDTFEHLLDGTPLLSDLLAGAPWLKLLITSRERLNLYGEWLLPIEGMDYPEAADHGRFEDYSAVQLWLQSARRVQPGFSLQDNAPAVLRICQLVEGMPLALELAADWVRLLPSAVIAEQLALNLDFLASSARDIPERHHSLRAVFDHSWNMLSSDEKMALAKMSVIRGPFDFWAAEAIGGASLPLLAALGDKSLLRADGAGRYGLHELLRQFAAEQYGRQGIEPEHRQRAIDYLTRAAERATKADAHRQAATLLGQAIAVAEDLGQPALLNELHYKRGQAFWKVGLWAQTRADLVAALTPSGAGTPDRRVEVLLQLAELSFFLSEVPRGRQEVDEALTLSETAQREDLIVNAMIKLASYETNDGNIPEAIDLLERALARGGIAHGTLGRLLYWMGHYPEAVVYLRQAVELTKFDETDHIFALQDLGLALAATGQYVAAVQAFDEAYRICKEIENWPLLARSVANAAGFHLDVFDYAGGEALVEKARGLARSANFVVAEVSAGLDLLLILARRKEVGRTDELVAEVAKAIEIASGSHAWLWELRFAQARAELALARGDWAEALQLADVSLQRSTDRKRVKYQVLGLKTRAEALVMLGRTPEALADMHNALALARSTGDPAMFVNAASALLAVETNDALAREAHTAAQRISAALPNDETRHAFETAEPVMLITRLAG